ncbi:O-antigen ligase family protein [Coleofasciculus chthonoplastes]|uniref:O-antigen ligase family protein n=1 Tax=Coleofasciculus chthonoplastes TaxID=64178 RepID=UPI0032FA90BC
MKELILHPLILTLLFFAGSVYFVIGFQLINSNNRWSKLFEQTCATVLLMIIGGVCVGLMHKFHPRALSLRTTTLPTISMTLATYSVCLVLLAPRLNNNLKDGVYVFSYFLKNNLFFCGYILVMLLSFSFSNMPGYTFKASIVHIGVTLVLIYIGKQYSWKELLAMLTWYHGIAVILFLVFGKQYLGHKNYVGPTMALSAIILYLWSVDVSKKYKLIFMSLATLAVVFVQQAESGMGKALIFILICLLGCLRFLKRLPPRIAFACMGVFLAIAVSLLILITENAEYIIVEKLGKDMTLTGRTLFWPLIVDAINRHPLFGYGYGGFWQDWRGADNPAFNIRAPNGYQPPHSHNGFLDIGVNFGWIGVSLFILSLLVNIYYGVLHLIRTKDATAGLPLVIFTWLIITNYTETSLVAISSGWAFYVLMTARLTMDVVAKNTSDDAHIQKTLAFESTSSSPEISATEDRNHYID